MAEAKKTETGETKAALPQNIVQIIPKIREELGPIGKDEQAQGGARYKFRSADVVIDSLAPLLNKYGVFTTVEDTPIEFRQRDAANNKFVTSVLLSKKVTFYGPDGSNVSSTTLGESSDFSDKATGGASTYAYRYALVQTFSIPVNGSDPDATYTEMPGTAPAAKATPAAREKPDLAAVKNTVKTLLEAKGHKTPQEMIAWGKENGLTPGWNGTVGGLEKAIDLIQKQG